MITLKLIVLLLLYWFWGFVFVGIFMYIDIDEVKESDVTNYYPLYFFISLVWPIVVLIVVGFFAFDKLMNFPIWICKMLKSKLGKKIDKND